MSATATTINPIINVLLPATARMAPILSLPRLLSLPPEIVLDILNRLDIVTLYCLRRLHPRWHRWVLDALYRHLLRTSILLTFEQEERWRLRVEIPFLHFNPATLLCTFMPQREPRTARRYYRSMFLRQPVLRAIRRQTRWDRGHGICILRRSANLLDRPWPVEIHRPGLHRVARRDSGGRDWECVYEITRHRPVPPAINRFSLAPRMTPIPPLLLVDTAGPPPLAGSATGPATAMAAAEGDPANATSSPSLLMLRDEIRRSGERWLCPSLFQCHLGFLVGTGLLTEAGPRHHRDKSTIRQSSLRRRRSSSIINNNNNDDNNNNNNNSASMTAKLYRDPDADLVRRNDPDKQRHRADAATSARGDAARTSSSAIALLARWLGRVVPSRMRILGANRRARSQMERTGLPPEPAADHPISSALPAADMTHTLTPVSAADLTVDTVARRRRHALTRTVSFSNLRSSTHIPLTSLLGLRRYRTIHPLSSRRVPATTTSTASTAAPPFFRLYEH